MAKRPTGCDDQASYSPNDVKEAVERTGFPFELAIARRVEAAGYLVTPNYNFEDHDTGKSREIDFYAVTTALSPSIDPEIETDAIFTVLLGSCKATTSPYVFFTHDDMDMAPFQLATSPPISGIPRKLSSRHGEAPVGNILYSENILLSSTTGRICSQFCELVRGQRDKALLKPNTEVMESVTVPLIKAMAGQIDNHNRAYPPESPSTDIDYKLYYLLLVLRGPMFEYYVSCTGESSVSETKHVVILRSYTSKTISGVYSVDAIHETFLEEYLHRVERESQQFTDLVRSRLGRNV